MAPVFTLKEFIHWFMPRENIVDSYVVENGGVVTDFASFYHLPSTIMNHPQYKLLKAGYSFYNVATKTPLNDLMNDLLIAAKNVCTLSISLHFACLLNKKDKIMTLMTW